MEAARPQRRLSAVLAADIVGFSRLVGADEEGTVARWQGYLATLIEPHISKYGGRVVKTLGDGLLAEFPSAVDAVRCAADVQAALAGAETGVPAERRIELRIGINIGDVIIDFGDIHGDGVNVAARLQAEAPAGGILVSQGVREAAAGLSQFAFADRGEMRLKNIARPVRAYVLRAAAARAPSRQARVRRWRHWGAAAAVSILAGAGIWLAIAETGRRGQEASAPPATVAPPAAPAVLSARDRPSIAVLPFNNMSGSAEQEYLSDGITEDIITALAKFPSLLVIARNTTFRYKGRAVDVGQVGRDLGVKYVLEGSLRRDQDRIRVTAQLIDTQNGAHIWAERYDRKIDDIFAVQDDLTVRIVGTLVRQVSRAELERVRRKPPANFVAYDHYLQAGHLHRASFAVRERGRPLHEARVQLELAISKDAGFALAYTRLAYNYFQAWAELPHFAPLDPEFRNPATLQKALGFAQKAVEVDPGLAESHASLGFVLFWLRRHAESFATYDRAFAINPNMQDEQYGNTLVLGGRARDSIVYIERLLRSDPSNGHQYGFMGLGHYLLREYEKAAEHLQTCKQLAPGWRPCSFWRAAALAQLDRMEEARTEAAENMRFNPNFTIRRWVAQFGENYAKSEDAEHIVAGLRKAGLPE